MSPDDTPAAELPDHATLAQALVATGLAVDPSELHGSLCGFIAGGGHAEAEDWLRRLEIDADGVSAATDSGAVDTIDQLRDATLAQFAAQDFGFDLLLPPDDSPLDERADELIAWCRGFLGGFGLASATSAALSAEATEALEDIGRIAAADLSYDGSEADEAALAEIIEFVRVAALLLHGDSAQNARRRRRAN